MESKIGDTSDLAVTAPVWRIYMPVKILAILISLVDVALLHILQSIYSTILFQVFHFHKRLEKYYVGPRSNVEHLFDLVAVVLLLGCVLTARSRTRSRMLCIIGSMKFLFIAAVVLFWWAFSPWFKAMIIIGM